MFKTAIIIVIVIIIKINDTVQRTSEISPRWLEMSPKLCVSTILSINRSAANFTGAVATFSLPYNETV